MKKLLITLLLISPFSFAEWGDVYYCQMTTYSETTFKGERTDYRTEKLTFKLDKTKNAMVFGKKGYFADHEMKLVEGSTYLLQELWIAEGDYDRLVFNEGKFIYGHTGFDYISSMSADCEKF